MSNSRRDPTTHLSLRPVAEADLPIFFEQMHDPAAIRMAAHQPREHAEFHAHWRRIMADPDKCLRTIVVDGEVAGHLGSWAAGGRRLVGYWVGSRWWGKGVASAALPEFLQAVKERPLYAHVARENGGSIRVLEKSGFVLDAAATAAQAAPADGVVELVYVLGPDGAA